MYNILEVANTHAGNIDYLMSLIKEFEEFDKSDKFGIKFQPFKYDKIATKEFEWYPVYEELFFNENEWKLIFSEADKTKDIWIDLFDEYGVLIIENNLDKVYGIKLQTSILDNNSVFKALKKLDLSNIKLIINIAGREKEDIDKVLKKYTNLNTEEILIEVGFQAYPTKLEDSGLAKVQYLKKHYNNKIVFADHVDGTDKDAKILPLIASMYGVEYIEKHIMHSTLETKYDHFSSVKYETYKELIAMQKRYIPLLDSEFINQAESDYLKKTYQIPILEQDKEAGTLIDVSNDFKFRRSGKQGLTLNDIQSLVDNYYILNNNKKLGETIQKEDFKKSNIAAIIACRLKSTRLAKKALLKIGDISSIELCIKNTLKLNDVNHVVLATSDNEQDAELSNYTYNDSVVFHQGDEEDVIGRYIDIIDTLKIDVLIRITGDMPYVSQEITDYLLKSHFQNGADYTVAKEVAVGTGVEIINTSALREVKKHFPNAEYSEYMTWYFQNNPEYFKLNFVDLPKKWIRDYRLTIDYQEDLDMFNKIEAYFKENKLEFSIEKLFTFLDNNPKVNEINLHLTLKYKTDKKLIDTLNKETKIK